MEQEQTDAMEEQPLPRSRFARYRRGLVIGGIVLLLVIAGLIYWVLNQGKQTTDDAQVYGHLVAITARVAGNVQEITVDDTDKVAPGQLLVQIDPSDYQQALSRAQADLAAQRAATAAAQQQTAVTSKTAPSSYGQAAAATQIASQGVEAAQSQLAAAESQVTAAEAGIRAAREQASAAQADVEAATSLVQTAREGIEAGQADVAAAESEAQTQAAELKRYQSLLQGGAIAQEQLDIVTNRYNASLSALRSAQSRLISARAAVTQAQARQVGSKALLARANSQVSGQIAALEQARAGVRAARAALAQSQSRLSQAQAAQSGAATVQQQIGLTESQRKAAAAKIRQSAADVQTASQNLSRTSLRAPVAGEVSNRSVQLGQHVSPGQALMSIIPLHHVWVVANFKETQIGDMIPGQEADITVDTYRGVHFKGKVQGIGAATGEITSLLPPQNATGNFVKVVQRIPVRIILDQKPPKDVVLRPGQNVVATVYTR